MSLSLIKKIYIKLLFFFLLIILINITKASEYGLITYKQGDNVSLVLFLKNNTNNQGITGATCTYDVYNQTGIKIIDDALLSEISDGLYTNESLFTDLGDYIVLYTCTKDSYIGQISSGFRIVSNYSTNVIINNLTQQLINLNTSILINITNQFNNLNLSIQEIKSIIEDNNSNIYNEILNLQSNITKLINQTDCSLLPLSTLCKYVKDINDSLINATTWSRENVTLTLSRLDWLYEEVGNCKYKSSEGLCDELKGISTDIEHIKDRMGIVYMLKFNTTLWDVLPNMTELATTTVKFMSNLSEQSFNTGVTTEQSTRTINLATAFIIIGLISICVILVTKTNH